jgi:chaperone BCS1
LQPGEKEHLVEDVKTFRASKQRYARLGIPYHRGYLLYGPPGTGKTSLVSALAAHLGLSIYVINLTDFTDRSLMNAVNQVPANSVLLFEEIDCARSDKAGESVSTGANSATQMPTEGNYYRPNGVPLSGLLNVLDSSAPANMLFVMTTNHISADQALLRPGKLITSSFWVRLRRSED